MGWRFFTAAGAQKFSGQTVFSSTESVSITGNQTDYALGASSSILRVSTDADGYTWQGLVGGTDGRVVVFQNVQANAGRRIILQHNNGVTAANGFSLPYGQNLYVPDRSSVVLVYDGTSNRWRGSVPGTSTATPADTGTASAGTAGKPPSAEDHVHNLETHSISKHTDVSRTLWFPAAMMFPNPGTDATPAEPLGVAGTNQYGHWLAKDANGESGMGLIFRVPEDWASGAVTAKLYYSVSATVGGSTAVVWRCQYVQLVSATTDISAAALTNAAGGTESQTYTINVAYISGSAATLFTPGGAGEMYYILFNRTSAAAGDTYTGNVRMLGAMLTYTANQ